MKKEENRHWHGWSCSCKNGPHIVSHILVHHLAVFLSICVLVHSRWLILCNAPYFLTPTNAFLHLRLQYACLISTTDMRCIFIVDYNFTWIFRVQLGLFLLFLIVPSVHDLCSLLLSVLSIFINIPAENKSLSPSLNESRNMPTSS